MYYYSPVWMSHDVLVWWQFVSKAANLPGAFQNQIFQGTPKWMEAVLNGEVGGAQYAIRRFDVHTHNHLHNAFDTAPGSGGNMSAHSCCCAVPIS